VLLQLIAAGHPRRFVCRVLVVLMAALAARWTHAGCFLIPMASQSDFRLRAACDSLKSLVLQLVFNTMRFLGDLSVLLSHFRPGQRQQQ
jgi:hypothetical protein